MRSELFLGGLCLMITSPARDPTNFGELHGAAMGNKGGHLKILSSKQASVRVI